MVEDARNPQEDDILYEPYEGLPSYTQEPVPETPPLLPEDNVPPRSQEVSDDEKQKAVATELMKRLEQARSNEIVVSQVVAEVLSLPETTLSRERKIHVLLAAQDVAIQLAFYMYEGAKKLARSYIASIRTIASSYPTDWSEDRKREWVITADITVQGDKANIDLLLDEANMLAQNYRELAQEIRGYIAMLSQRRD